MKRVSIRVPADRIEEARADWLERFPGGFEEVELGDEVELAAYTDEPPTGLRAEDVEPGWEDRWRAFHRPVRVGPFWIGPPWATAPRGATAVVIDPGQAFGTGAHPTTRLCVELLTELEPASLLDVGCGSGVLAIAAALSGFHPVAAVDVDPTAVEATRRNAATNGVSLDVRLLDALAEPLPAADVVVANVTLEAADALLARVDARLVVCSGYLERDEPQLGRRRRLARRTLDGWAADLLERAE